LHKACWMRHYILMCMDIVCRQYSLLTVSAMLLPCLLWMIIYDKQTVCLCVTLGWICISLAEPHSWQGSALQDITTVTIIISYNTQTLVQKLMFVREIFIRSVFSHWPGLHTPARCSCSVQTWHTNVCTLERRKWSATDTPLLFPHIV